MEACSYGTSVPRMFSSSIIVSLADSSLSTCLHTFLPTNLSTMAGGSPITALAQSPAVDVIGIGFASGECILYDIRSDEKIIRVFMEGAAIRSIAFRTGCRRLV